MIICVWHLRLAENLIKAGRVLLKNINLADHAHANLVQISASKTVIVMLKGCLSNSLRRRLSGDLSMA